MPSSVSSTRDRISVGIIGTGRIAETHARYFAQIPWVDIVAVSHPRSDKAQSFVERLHLQGARVFEDHREMLTRIDLDAVSICTPNMAHRDPAVHALQAGKHVLLEKPMAVALQDARDIMQATEASGKILMVSLQSAFSAQFQVARQVVDSGALGHIYYSEAIAFRRSGTPGGPFLRKVTAGAGALVDIGVYAIHTALTLMGTPTPTSVSATTNNYLSRSAAGLMRRDRFTWRAEDVEVEDFATAFVRFDNGASMFVKACWAANVDSIGRPLFLGTKGGMALNPEGPLPPVELHFNRHVGGLTVTVVPERLPDVDTWQAKINAFAGAVRDGAPSPIDPHGVFLVSVITDGALRSAECGHEVSVETAW